ncbi:MAG TPA: hypothetical protein VMQ11_14225 [Alphaproteobacteria bacterium]|nr:hypothetical protein [Alphaproteobacteria bacterium]
MTSLKLAPKPGWMVALAAAAVLAGCSGMSSSNPQPSNGNPTGPQQAGFAQFTDIPIPPKNTIDLDRTLVFGSDRDWIGRVSLSSSMAVSEVYDFYKREMPKLGWNELTSVRSSTSVLTYEMDNRVATIQVGSGRFGLGTQVDFWMNPKSGGGASTFTSGRGAGGGGGGGAGRGSIDSAPLK